jgi:hypothetical protein
LSKLSPDPANIGFESAAVLVFYLAGMLVLVTW